MKRSRLSKSFGSRRKTRAKRVVQITGEQWELLDRMYGGEFPEYLSVRNRNHIEIKAAQWEGAPVRVVKITPEDVIEYYRSQARDITSGIRTLAGFSGDWRMVDNMAKESLEVFKIINHDALVRLGKGYGMELK